MTPTHEHDSPGPGASAGSAGVAPRVLLVDTDAALAGLLETWLAAEGCELCHGSVDAGTAQPPADLVIVDVAFPRQDGVASIRRIAGAHPKAPILALSSTFFAGIECCGPVSRELGVDCVLAQPVSREALTRAVRRLLSR